MYKNKLLPLFASFLFSVSTFAMQKNEGEGLASAHREHENFQVKCDQLLQATDITREIVLWRMILCSSLNKEEEKATRDQKGREIISSGIVSEPLAPRSMMKQMAYYGATRPMLRIADAAFAAKLYEDALDWATLAFEINWYQNHTHDENALKAIQAIKKTLDAAAGETIVRTNRFLQTYRDFFPAFIGKDKEQRLGEYCDEVWNPALGEGYNKGFLHVLPPEQMLRRTLYAVHAFTTALVGLGDVRKLECFNNYRRSRINEEIFTQRISQLHGFNAQKLINEIASGKRYPPVVQSLSMYLSDGRLSVHDFAKFGGAKILGVESMANLNPLDLAIAVCFLEDSSRLETLFNVGRYLSQDTIDVNWFKRRGGGNFLASCMKRPLKSIKAWQSQYQFSIAYLLESYRHHMASLPLVAKERGPIAADSQKRQGAIMHDAICNLISTMIFKRKVKRSEIVELDFSTLNLVGIPRSMRPQEMSTYNLAASLLANQNGAGTYLLARIIEKRNFLSNTIKAVLETKFPGLAKTHKPAAIAAVLYASIINQEKETRKAYVRLGHMIERGAIKLSEVAFLDPKIASSLGIGKEDIGRILARFYLAGGSYGDYLLASLLLNDKVTSLGNLDLFSQIFTPLDEKEASQYTNVHRMTFDSEASAQGLDAVFREAQPVKVDNLNLAHGSFLLQRSNTSKSWLHVAELLLNNKLEFLDTDTWGAPTEDGKPRFEVRMRELSQKDPRLMVAVGALYLAGKLGKNLRESERTKEGVEILVDIDCWESRECLKYFYRAQIIGADLEEGIAAKIRTWINDEEALDESARDAEGDDQELPPLAVETEKESEGEHERSTPVMVAEVVPESEHEPASYDRDKSAKERKLLRKQRASERHRQRILSKILSPRARVAMERNYLEGSERGLTKLSPQELQKLENFYDDICENPYQQIGRGRPKKLSARYLFKGEDGVSKEYPIFRRKISSKNRFVYFVADGKINIISAHGHYGD